jgi:AraC-like DNA-binding protein
MRRLYRFRRMYAVRMRRATLEELAASPPGKYVAGEDYVHFCMSPTLWGVILWGRPTERTGLSLYRSLVLELRSPAVPHASLVDATRIDGADPRAFEQAERYITQFKDSLANWVTRLALVRPHGLDGAMISGAYQVIPAPYPVAVFDDLDAAVAWLAPDADPTAAPAVAAMYRDVTGTPEGVGELRTFLDANLVEEIAIAKVAKQLGVSERTLQRKLGDAGTTFTDEVADARVRAAKRLLADTDAPLTEIALDVGCGSLQSFSALFRRRTGESPSTFRARSRR